VNPGNVKPQSKKYKCPKYGSDVEIVELSAWDKLFSFK
jgi:hypothetical protein